MLAEARRRHPVGGARRGRRGRPAAPGRGLRAAVGNFVLNHLPAPERAVAEIRRVLAPGGGVALSVWERPGVAPAGWAWWARRSPRRACGAAVPDGRPALLPLRRPASRCGPLLEGAGLLRRARGGGVADRHGRATPDELWEGVLGGSVRTSATILAQPEDGAAPGQGRPRAAGGGLPRAWRPRAPRLGRHRRGPPMRPAVAPARGAREPGTTPPSSPPTSEDATLDAGLPGRARPRRRARGDRRPPRRAGTPDAGRIVEWVAREHEDGAAVWVERIDGGRGRASSAPLPAHPRRSGDAPLDLRRAAADGGAGPGGGPARAPLRAPLAGVAPSPTYGR